jgi:diacylglycerol kinase (ATP)
LIDETLASLILTIRPVKLVKIVTQLGELHFPGQPELARLHRGDTIKWVPPHSVNRTVPILVNSVAGRGKAAAVAKSIAKALADEKFDPQIIPDSPAKAVELSRNASALIVIGGDGTLRAAAKELLKSAAPSPPILPIPMGTANLMSEYLGINWSPEEMPAEAVKSINRLKTVDCDVAAVNDDPFLIMAGIGFDAQIVHEVHRARRGPITQANYLLPAARTLVSYDYPPLEISIDGKPFFPLTSAVAFIANVSQYGMGFAMLPAAVPDDGLLDLCVVPVKSAVEAIRKFLLAAAQEHLTEEGILFARGKEISVHSPNSVPVQADGDPAGYTPATFRLLPTRLQFIVPA